MGYSWRDNGDTTCKNVFRLSQRRNCSVWISARNRESEFKIAKTRPGYHFHALKKSWKFLEPNRRKARMPNSHTEKNSWQWSFQAAEISIYWFISKNPKMLVSQLQRTRTFEMFQWLQPWATLTIKSVRSMYRTWQFFHQMLEKRSQPAGCKTTQNSSQVPLPTITVTVCYSSNADGSTKALPYSSPGTLERKPCTSKLPFTDSPFDVFQLMRTASQIYPDIPKSA